MPALLLNQSVLKVIQKSFVSNPLVADLMLSIIFFNYRSGYKKGKVDQIEQSVIHGLQDLHM